MQKFLIFAILISVCGLIKNVHTLNCYTCTSANDPTCATLNYPTGTTDLPIVTCDIGETLCHVYVENGVTIRGCQPPALGCEGAECNACSTDNCNAGIFPQNRLQCHQCLGEDCNTAFSSYACEYYDNSNTCYIHIENGIIQRGCTTDNSQCISGADNCEICTGPSCNNRILDDEYCYSCNTEIGQNCEDSLQPDMITLCPQSLNRLGCFIFNNAGGIINTGCLSSISTFEISYCSNQNFDCKTCSNVDNCNDKLEFTKCAVCSSQDTTYCYRGPELVSHQICREYDDECFLHVYDDVVTRGCISESPQFEDNCTNSRICEKCSDREICNDKLIDVDFCYECTDENPDCRDNPNMSMRKQCPLTVAPQGCYRFDDGGEIFKRGCMSDISEFEIQYCNGNNGYCKSCIGNECNAQVDFHTCHKCNSATDSSCITSPDSTGVCRNYVDECIYRLNGNNIIRGCLSEQTVAIQNNCRNGINCEICEGPNCNSKISGEEYCIMCDSDTNPNCRTELDTIEMQHQCPLSLEKMGCYRYDDGGDIDAIIKRGCLADLLPSEINICNRNQECKTCIGDNCNEQIDFYTCHKCNSATDSTCILSPDSTGICRNYVDECIYRQDGNNIIRGCLSEQTQTIQNNCRNGINCEICEGPNCNIKVPEEEYCIMCDSDIDPNCRTELNATDMQHQCPWNIQKAGCYRYDDGGGIDAIIKRGCLADLLPSEINICNRNRECKTCIGNNCNEQIDFSKCRSCNSMSNVACIRSPNSISETICNSYIDECYVYAINDVITRGCLSEAPNQITSECNNGVGDICTKCSGANCNNRIVDGEFCVMCDSEIDSDCVDNLDIAEMQDQCPLAVKRLGCYIFNNGDDIVKRGCMSALLQTERNMCRRNDDNCKSCLTDSCNTRIGFTECAVCSSQDTTYCFRGPELVSHQICREYDDECFLHVNNDVVTRGCISASPEFEDDCTNSRICEKCSDREICNDKLIDVDFCYECTDENPDCRDNPNISMRKQCPLTVAPQGCYRFDDGGEIIKRGCISDISEFEIQYCNGNNGYCKSCIGNECNAQVDFHTCYKCNSATDFYCATSPISTGICRNYVDECIYRQEEDNIIRGCLSEQTQTIQNNCRNGINCEICEGPNCNGLILEDEYCIMCDTETDPNCRNDINIIEMQHMCQFSVERAGCYRLAYGDGQVQRGCYAELNEMQKQRCSDETNPFCKICIGDNCNIAELRECYTCDSLTDPNCVYATNGFNSTVCHDDTDTCRVFITEGRTVRGCTQEVEYAPCTAEFTLCHECDQSLCNGGIFPVGRPQCHQCTGSDCATTTQANVAPCLNYNAGQQCYTFVDDVLNTHRGCFGEGQTDMCNDMQELCISCGVTTMQACNNMPTINPPQLNCIQCSGDVACAWGFQPATATICSNNVIFPRVETCYTETSANSIVRRGCTLENPNCLINDNCETCSNGDGCNNINVETQTCVHCRSNVAGQESCASENLPSEFSRECATPFYEYGRRGCYSLRESNGVIVRGCAPDLSEELRENCENESYPCNVCVESNCNNGRAPSGAKRFLALSLASLISICILSIIN